MRVEWTERHRIRKDEAVHNAVSLMWRKSSYSKQGNCLEVAVDQGVIRVRDSKDPNGHELAVAPAVWIGFVGSIRSTRR